MYRWVVREAGRGMSGSDDDAVSFLLHNGRFQCSNDCLWKANLSMMMKTINARGNVELGVGRERDAYLVENILETS